MDFNAMLSATKMDQFDYEELYQKLANIAYDESYELGSNPDLLKMTKIRCVMFCNPNDIKEQDGTMWKIRHGCVKLDDYNIYGDDLPNNMNENIAKLENGMGSKELLDKFFAKLVEDDINDLAYPFYLFVFPFFYKTFDYSLMHNKLDEMSIHYSHFTNRGCTYKDTLIYIFDIPLTAIYNLKAEAGKQSRYLFIKSSDLDMSYEKVSSEAKERGLSLALTDVTADGLVKLYTKYSRWTDNYYEVVVKELKRDWIRAIYKGSWETDHSKIYENILQSDFPKLLCDV